MNNVYRETIQQFDVREPIFLTVRVWREVRSGEVACIGHDMDVSKCLATMMSGAACPPLEDIATALLSVDRVAAVEVKDRADNGCVLYRSELITLPDGRVLQVI